MKLKVLESSTLRVANQIWVFLDFGQGVFKGSKIHKDLKFFYNNTGVKKVYMPKEKLVFEEKNQPTNFFL